MARFYLSGLERCAYCFTHPIADVSGFTWRVPSCRLRIGLTQGSYRLCLKGSFNKKIIQLYSRSQQLPTPGGMCRLHESLRSAKVITAKIVCWYWRARTRVIVKVI